jgi:hypothetical protein
MMRAKITAEHLARSAIVYVRQSTMPLGPHLTLDDIDRAADAVRAVL